MSSDIWTIFLSMVGSAVIFGAIAIFYTVGRYLYEDVFSQKDVNHKHTEFAAVGAVLIAASIVVIATGAGNKGDVIVPSPTPGPVVVTPRELNPAPPNVPTPRPDGPSGEKSLNNSPESPQLLTSQEYRENDAAKSDGTIASTSGEVPLPIPKPKFEYVTSE